MKPNDLFTEEKVKTEDQEQMNPTIPIREDINPEKIESDESLSEDTVPLGHKPEPESAVPLQIEPDVMKKVAEVTMDELRSITTDKDRKEQLDVIGQFIVQIFQQWTQFQLPRVKRASDEHPFPLRVAETMSLTSAFSWMFMQKIWEFECQMYGKTNPWKVDGENKHLIMLRMQVINALGTQEFTSDQIRTLSMFIKEMKSLKN